MVSLRAEHATTRRPIECGVGNSGRRRRRRTISPGLARSSGRRDGVLESSRIVEGSRVLENRRVLVGSRVLVWGRVLEGVGLSGLAQIRFRQILGNVRESINAMGVVDCI